MTAAADKFAAWDEPACPFCTKAERTAEELRQVVTLKEHRIETYESYMESLRLVSPALHDASDPNVIERVRWLALAALRFERHRDAPALKALQQACELLRDGGDE